MDETHEAEKVRLSRKNWIQTWSGKKLIPTAITPDMVGPIEEIARSLAHEFRFTRQASYPYTVAQHCVMGSRLIDGRFALAFLLHELSEVYLPDIASPLKSSLRVDVGTPSVPWLINWADLESLHTRVILESLGLLSTIWPLIGSAHVKEMDLAMLAAEKRDLMGLEPESWMLTVQPPPGLYISEVWTPDQAETQFLKRYRELF